MAKRNPNMEKEKKFVWGQYFTRRNIVKRVLNLLLEYKKYDKNIRILEPSSGTKNFVRGLKDRDFKNIVDCEIDTDLTNNPCDFFLFPLKEKFDLIIGNPPFTKYNVKNSYYYSDNYKNKEIKPEEYLTNVLIKKPKIQMENVFILKSIKHFKDKNSSIAFVLPISFFIAKKNKEIKKEIINNFSTIIIYQNDKNWFDEPIPCCFAIFTNILEYKDKIILLYEDDKSVKEILNKQELSTEELIPQSFLYKKNNKQEGIPLSKFLSERRVKYNRSYENNNVSGANILERQEIPQDKNVSDYYLAVVRVGNVSVGKTGLINKEEDILNDMFFVFEFKEECNKDKKLKERICKLINENQEHFKNSTIRVGSKSIKKSDILDFKIKI
ncbi:MAG: N-6 DNA methylase [Candidatus Pacearchaeota archaeon]|nr:MAG: N-6 DNA methylase [Candidatus Pacearchaeota archaeon]